MKVLIVVDMQNDFINEEVLGTPEAAAILPEVCALIKDYHDAGDRVIFTRDMHEEDYLSTIEGRHLPIEHCICGSDGSAIHKSIEMVTDFNTDIFINKPTFGSLQLPTVLENLDRPYARIEKITLVGVCTGICVISNAIICKAKYWNIPIAVRANACACVTPASHKQALEAMKLLQIEIEENDND